MLETREHPPPILKTSMVSPWVVMTEDHEHSPPILKMSMAASWRRCRRPGSTHNISSRRRWLASWETKPETWERPPPILKTSMADPLGGDDGGLGVLTTYLEDADGGASRRQCQRPGAATTYPKDIYVGPLGGDGGGPGALTTYLDVVDGGLPGRR
jgi:hypothetical protein